MVRRGTKHRLRSFLIFLLILAVLLGLWAYGNFTFGVVEYEIPISKVTQEIRIVHLSDLHSAQYGPDNASLIKKIEQCQPDLIFATGDMATAHDQAGQERAIALLSSFDVPVYFVPGEHDHSQDFSDALSEAGVHVLRYESETITVQDTELVLYGIDNAYFGPNFNLSDSLPAPDESRLNILLAHIPNLEAYASFGTDLSFCGDTHGGLIRLPILGPAYLDGNWFPRLTTDEQPIDKGIFSYNDHTMLVSGGLGNYPAPIRMGNRPECSLVRLVPDSN